MISLESNMQFFTSFLGDESIDILDRELSSISMEDSDYIDLHMNALETSDISYECIMDMIDEFNASMEAITIDSVIDKIKAIFKAILNFLINLVAGNTSIAAQLKMVGDRAFILERKLQEKDGKYTSGGYGFDCADDFTDVLRSTVECIIFICDLLETVDKVTAKPVAKDGRLDFNFYALKGKISGISRNIINQDEKVTKARNQLDKSANNKVKLDENSVFGIADRIMKALKTILYEMNMYGKSNIGVVTSRFTTPFIKKSVNGMEKKLVSAAYKDDTDVKEIQQICKNIMELIQKLATLANKNKRYLTLGMRQITITVDAML